MVARLTSYKKAPGEWYACMLCNRYINPAFGATHAGSCELVQEAKMEDAKQRTTGTVAGMKYDHTKNRYELVPTSLTKWVAAVLTFGAEKYVPWSWRGVDRMQERYYAAARRHLDAWYEEYLNRRDRITCDPTAELDQESGLPHLAHAATCIAFLLDAEHGHTKLDIADVINRAREAAQKEIARQQAEAMRNAHS
jgi:hypothetical protein